MSWVTLDRICQERVNKDGVRLELVRNGRPLRSSADSLSDDELLAKLKDLGLDVDRDGVERLCAGALSAEEVAGPITHKLQLDDTDGRLGLDQLARPLAEMKVSRVGRRHSSSPLASRPWTRTGSHSGRAGRRANAAVARPLRRSNLAQDKPTECNSIRSGLMSTLKSSPSTWASLDSVVNDGSCSPASNRAITSLAK